jgi:hypothetical protein
VPRQGGATATGQDLKAVVEVCGATIWWRAPARRFPIPH